ncbi:FkbM family methyltransferase [Rubripirellula reticaptiva]|uniref:Methyltransferase FkbM domain-containing protein n=1 Tax=Rubripirellula reticaptiva TaxID=2528013 RepID=A0A5C6F6T2_9BACT|nr:FkbM family methyltransferase [Rubripirellula reticaptiva]TWU55221.1 hypothetical protein Poly59_15180 [Rubripirellula reticaptiva]
MSRLLKSAVTKYLEKKGRRLIRIKNRDSGSGFIHHLHQQMSIELLLDVGANSGQTGLEFRENGFNGRIISFEPQPSIFDLLRATAAADSSWDCRREGLGATSGEMEMEISGFSPSSSLLPIAEKHIEVWPNSAPIGSVRIPIRTLDEIMGEINAPKNRISLKIDVQGYESSVLAGATKTLSCVDIALVELLFAPLYKDQSKYYEVIGLLEESGLQFAGFFNQAVDPKSETLLFADGLFIRPRL